MFDVFLQVAITQTISGTGALRVGGEFLARWFPTSKKIFVPTPTWGNHIPIFKDSGLEVNHYKYFDKKTNGLDFEGMVNDIKVRIASIMESVILFIKGERVTQQVLLL